MMGLNVNDYEMEIKLPYIFQIFTENSLGAAAFSYPEMEFIKSNTLFLDVLGTSDRESVEFRYADFGIRDIDDFNNLIKAGKSFKIKENKNIESGLDFFNINFTPVMENDSTRYVIVTFNFVTENDQKNIYTNAVRKENEELRKKNDALEKMIDNVTDAISLRYKYLFEEKEKEYDALLNEKNVLESVVENVSDAVLVCTIEGNFIFSNKRAVELFGEIDSKSVVFLSSKTNYYGLDGKRLMPEDLPLIKVLKGESSSTKHIVMCQGEKYTDVSISSHAVPDNKGNTMLVVTCIQDMTEIVKYEELFNKQRDYFYKIIDTLELPIFRVTYPDLSIVGLNRKAYDHVIELADDNEGGLEKSESGESVINTYLNLRTEDNNKQINKMIETKSPVYIKNIEFIRKKKKNYINTIFQPIFNSREEIEEFLIISYDVTNEIEQKETLRNLLKMKDEFLYTISHEFKTPLTVINAAIQTMELICSRELSEKAREFIGKIRQNTYRQLRLVNNLLDITRMQGGYMKITKNNMDIVSTTRYITESVNLYARQKGVKLKFSSRLKKKVIAVDDEKYERIILNLLSNAIKFTPKGKAITVKVARKEKMVRIEVADQGVGIPKDKQDIIFERFGQVDSSLTRQAEGSGIGLSLVKTLVTALKGDIYVDSDTNKGSVFTVLLPDYILKEKTSSKKIAILDDSRLIQSAAIEFSDIYL